MKIEDEIRDLVSFFEISMKLKKFVLTIFKITTVEMNIFQFHRHGIWNATTGGDRNIREGCFRGFETKSVSCFLWLALLMTPTL